MQKIVFIQNKNKVIRSKTSIFTTIIVTSFFPFLVFVIWLKIFLYSMQLKLFWLMWLLSCVLVLVIFICCVFCSYKDNIYNNFKRVFNKFLSNLRVAVICDFFTTNLINFCSLFFCGTILLSDKRRLIKIGYIGACKEAKIEKNNLIHFCWLHRTRSSKFDTSGII